MPKYEYYLFSCDFTGTFNGKVDIEHLQEEMNELGQNGWELVNSNETNKNGYTKSILFIFKREIY